MANVDRELAKMLYPKPSDVVREGLGSKVQTAYVYGTALSDSEDGTVQVSVEGDPMGVDASLDVPTSNAIQEGDRVLVSISGNVPVEAVVKGSGDATRSIATEALDVANATGQYFWHDENGAHVSTEALNPTGASNSLWNSLGLLIRKAANNLVSITQSAIAFFDGNGNASSNIVAQFGSSGAQIGKTGAANIALDTSKTVFSGSSGTELLTIEAESGHAVIEAATGQMHVRNTGTNGETASFSAQVYGGDSAVTMRAANTDGSAFQEAQVTDVGSFAKSHVERGGGSSTVELYADDNGASSVTISADDVYVDMPNAHYQFTGAGNIRTNDSGGNATAYFVKYDATSDTRTQLEHRGACIWQNGSGNLHLANGMSESAATWEYSFEAGGLYRRTKSGSTWSSWTKLA